MTIESVEPARTVQFATHSNDGLDLEASEACSMEERDSKSSKGVDPEHGSEERGGSWGGGGSQEGVCSQSGLFWWLRGFTDQPCTDWVQKVQRLVLVVILVASWWTVLWVLVGASAEPHGQLFILGVVYVSALLLGEVARRLGTHPLIGMMAAGVACRFIPFIAAKDLKDNIASPLRSFALVVILLRAGLGLDLKTMKKHRLLCTAACLGPTGVEVASVMLLTHALLDFPWKWGAMTGFMISGVSPAVVVPALLQLQERGYGVKKGVPALILVASALDDVLGIAGFFIFHDVIFGDSGEVLNAFRVPLELILGLLGGLAFGVVGCLLCPSAKLRGPVGVVGKEPKASTLALVRSSYGLGLGMLSVCGGKYVEFSGAGALAVLVMGTTLAQGWGSVRSARVKQHMLFLWTWLALPLLFGVIGAKLDPAYFSKDIIWKSLVIIPGSLFLRVLSTLAAATGSLLSWKERVFVALAWAPKATVQAALCSVALASANEPERALLPGNPLEKELGRQVFAIAAMAIILTAPLGAMFLSVCGPRMLEKGEPKVPAELEAATLPEVHS